MTENLLSWDAWVETARGGFHFVLALTAIIIGAVVLLRRKGTISHRVLGTIYVICLMITNITALTMYEIDGRMTLFHWFAILSLATFTPGYIAILVYKFRRTPFWLELHRQFIAWSYYGLCAAGVWQVGLRLAVDIFGPEQYRLLIIIFSIVTFTAPILIGALFLRPRRTATS